MSAVIILTCAWFSVTAVVKQYRLGAARVAVHRLGKRFRAFFRQTIAETVDANDDVDSEMRYLVGVLSRA